MGAIEPAISVHSPSRTRKTIESRQDYRAFCSAFSVIGWRADRSSVTFAAIELESRNIGERRQ